jgi:redox-sensitive bicupin YhaK (pirin superfamily)
MTTIRPIRKVYRSAPTVEGAGVRLKRAFGYREVPSFDPFLLLDDFHSKDPSDYLAGFPWHPHRGIETITYVLHGSVDHRDSMGNSGRIGEGDVQWMTAGSGIIHQEMPGGDADGLLWGFQLWANLPASHKMMEPRYRGITKEEIPEVRPGKGIRVRIISGTVGTTTGPVTGIVTMPEYLDVSLEPAATFSHRVEEARNAFAYIIYGGGYFEEARDPFGYPVVGSGYFDMDRGPLLLPESVVLFGSGDQIRVEAGEEGLRFLFASAVPIGEPVAWYGPIVMNTDEELRKAFYELREGTFIRFRGESDSFPG